VRAFTETVRAAVVTHACCNAVPARTLKLRGTFKVSIQLDELRERPRMIAVDYPLIAFIEGNSGADHRQQFHKRHTEGYLVCRIVS